RVGRIGTDRLRAERGDLPRRVGAFERRQIHAADRKLERMELCVLLDRALRQLTRARLNRDLVDRADPRQARLEGQLEPARQCGCLSHTSSLALGTFSAFLEGDESPLLAAYDAGLVRPRLAG